MATRNVTFASDRVARRCPEDELRMAERTLSVLLPTTVRIMLRTLVENATVAIPGLCVGGARICVYREAAQHLLADSRADYVLRASDFVFLCDDYQFWFCPCDAGDDPPVYRFVEGERWPRQVARSFIAWASSMPGMRARRA